MLIELFYIGKTEERTDGRASGRTVTWLPKYLGCIGYQIVLPMVLPDFRYKYSFPIPIVRDWNRFKSSLKRFLNIH